MAMEKQYSFQQIILGQHVIYMQKWSSTLTSHHLKKKKINSKWIKNPNGTVKTTKFFEESISVNVCDLGLGIKFWIRHQNTSNRGKRRIN